MEQQRFLRENLERIQAVESSFGGSGRPLSKPGRVLVGRGHLMKQGRRRPQLKAFFLFSDVLVYGSVILNTGWNNKQKVIALEDLHLEDMEDGLGRRNQWLMQTPQKSFFVWASSSQEKRSWMENIAECRSNALRGAIRPPAARFAASWIPDRAAYRCMRCFSKFSGTKRRHHCRSCGFLVCNSCSRTRVVILNIHPDRKLRVCRFCHNRCAQESSSHLNAQVTGRSVSEEEGASSGEEEEAAETMQRSTGGGWLDSHTGTWTRIGTYMTHKTILVPPAAPHT